MAVLFEFYKESRDLKYHDSGMFLISLWWQNPVEVETKFNSIWKVNTTSPFGLLFIETFHASTDLGAAGKMLPTTCLCQNSFMPI